MRIVVYSNCQGNAVRKLLPLMADMMDHVDVRNFENYKLIAGDGSYDELCKALRNVDVFIYQPVGSTQGKFSTHEDVDNVMSHVRRGAQKISMPYVYNNGIWPLFHEGTIGNSAPIEKLFVAGADVHEAVAAFDKGDLFFDIRGRTQRSLQILREREADTDVKVADYLEANIRDRELMLVQAHPSTEVFVCAINQILKIMFGCNFRPIKLDLQRLGNNYAELPGRYPIDKYCIEEGGLTYTDGPEEWSGHYYHSLIHQHFRDWQAAQAIRE